LPRTMSSARTAPIPRQPAPLVWPERPAEARGRLRRREPLVGPTGQQVTEPAVGVHFGQRQLAGRPAGADCWADGRAKHLGGGHRPRPLAREKLERGLQVPAIEFHPLAAEADKRQLALGQLG
jgi:hypothetical protein